jgi:carbohydrate-selective porin OprB
MLFQQTHGRGLSTDFVGDAQIVSTIDSFDNITQVSEYWWETPLVDDFLTLRLGKQDVNGEFHLTEIAADLVHSAYGIPPTLPAPTYPHNSMGAVLIAKLSEPLAAKAGIWDGFPDGGTWGFSGTGITYTIVELERTHTLLGELPGVFDIGFSHLSAIDVIPDEFTPEQYTIYCDFEQALYREDLSDEKNEQGLACFTRYGTVYPQADVDFKDYFSAGLVYKGLLDGRDEDLIGAGVNHLRHNLGGTGTETATEVFYKAHVNPWATVQPVFQFISSPSGIYRDSIVAGVRFQIVL